MFTVKTEPNLEVLEYWTYVSYSAASISRRPDLTQANQLTTLITLLLRKVTVGGVGVKDRLHRPINR